MFFYITTTKIYLFEAKLAFFFESISLRDVCRMEKARDVSSKISIRKIMQQYETLLKPICLLKSWFQHV